MRALGEAILLRSFAGIFPELMLDPNMSSQWRLVTAMFVRGQRGKIYLVCLAGKRACPLEDCGGKWENSDFPEAISNPEHEQHEELLEWIGGEFDPETFDVVEVNEETRARILRSPLHTCFRSDDAAAGGSCAGNAPYCSLPPHQRASATNRPIILAPRSECLFYPAAGQRSASDISEPVCWNTYIV